jgi:coenzyme F420-reducing hydrogenase beta subunit
MISIQDKTKCCGCNACAQTCPRKCIKFQPDEEGFLYPVVNEDECVNCGACDGVCPMLKDKKPSVNEFEKPSAYAAYCLDDSIRLNSTSGGLWMVIAQKVLDEGGSICGAVFDEDFNVIHCVTQDKRVLPQMQSSKYLQSAIGNVYREIQSILEAGNKVFVCGTPCQIAGLRYYLRKNYDNLFCADLICKAVPSPKVFHLYLQSLEKQYKAKSVSVKFKYKDASNPWGYITTRIDFQNGRTYIKRKLYDSYMASYLRQGYMIRPSCLKCKFIGYPRFGDITLGDFWGVENSIAEVKDKAKGYSLVLVNTSKGEQLLDDIKPFVVLQQAKLEDAERYNHQLLTPYVPEQYDDTQRKQFYDDMENYGYNYVNKKYIKCSRNLFERIYRKVTGNIL